jgi:small-conductance mechanosensitive channel
MALKIVENILQDPEFNLTERAQEHLKESSNRFMIKYTKLTPRVYTSVKDFGVNFSLRYLCDPRKRRASTEKVWLKILEEFEKHKNIDFAYPTTRFYNNKLEGKDAP